jgi:hypothetical protein
MDKAIEQIFKVFNHLAREVQIYLFSGLLVAINVLAIDHLYFQSSLLTFIQKNSLVVPAAIVLYLIGQFCMAFYYVILEMPKLDMKISKFFKFDFQVDSKVLPKLYSKDTEVYIHFVERYIILSMMRWTLSAACFINFITDIAVLAIKDFRWQLLLALIIFASGAFFFFLLTTKTESDYARRINSLKEMQ